MNGWGLGGVLGAALALVAGEVLVTSTSKSGSGATRLLSLARAPAGLAAKWMDPGVPLIERRQAKAAPVAKTTARPAPSAAATIAQAQAS